MSLNPYQSPLASPDEAPATPPAGGIAGRWLVRLSLLLAIMIEVVPIEADIASVLLYAGDVPRFLMVRAVCLAAVLGPLSVYLWLNGKAGIREAKGRITAITIIVVVKLAAETYAVIRVLDR
jgi:hypothetical protein